MLARPQQSQVRLAAERAEINKLSRSVILRPTACPLECAQVADRYFSQHNAAQRQAFGSSLKAMFAAVVTYVHTGRLPPFLIGGTHTAPADIAAEYLHPMVQVFRWSVFYGKYYLCPGSQDPARPFSLRQFAKGVVDAIDAGCSEDTEPARERAAVVVAALMSALEQRDVANPEFRAKLGLRCFTRLCSWAATAASASEELTSFLVAEVMLIQQSHYTYAPCHKRILADLLRNAACRGDGPSAGPASPATVDRNGNLSSGEDQDRSPSPPRRAVATAPLRRSCDNSLGGGLAGLPAAGPNTSNNSNTGGQRSRMGFAEEEWAALVSREELGLTVAAAGAPPAEDADALVRRLGAVSFGATDRDDVPYMFLCPIGQDVMVDPVTAADGYNYDRRNITAWLRRKQVSPMTRRVMETRLVPNFPLRAAIEEHLSQNESPRRPA